MKSNKINIFIMVLISLLLLAAGFSLSKAALSEQDFSKICADLSKIDKTELNERLIEAGISIENTTLPYIYEICSNLAQEVSADSASSTQNVIEENAKKIKKRQDTDVKESRIIENKGKGRIKFNKEIIVDIVDVDKNPNVYISDNLISINTEELPELKEPAALMIENLRYMETPSILYSSKFTTNREEIAEPCPEDICSGISYDPVIGALTFNVSHFSSFTTTSSSCPENYTDCNGDGTGSDADGCENPYPKCSCTGRGKYYFCADYAWFWNYYGQTYSWCFGKTSWTNYWFGGFVIDSTGEKGGFPDCSQSQYCCFDYYSDFISTCGNGVCDVDKPYYAESNGNCPKDCYIGDNVCDTKYENPANDPNDCCTDTAQCNTLQYCSENNLSDCSIKKSSEISGTYNFKNLTIDSTTTLKTSGDLTINAENIKVYGKIIVNNALSINSTNVEIYGKIDGTHSDKASFAVNSKRYYDIGSTVDFSGENGVKGKDGISGPVPTAGEDGTDGKDGKPIIINTEVFEGGSFISNGGNGGEGGKGGSGACVGSTDSSNYCDEGLCSCSGDPNGKPGGTGGNGGSAGAITINAKISKGAISAIANGGNAASGGKGGDGSRGPTTGTYKESFSWGGRYYTITHILYNGGDSGSGREAGEAGKGGAINMNFDKHSCSKAGNLSANGGNSAKGGDAGRPSDGSVCYTSFTSSCFPNLPGKAGLAGKSANGGDAGTITISVNRKGNIPAINNYQFSANGGNGADGGNGANGAYSCYNNRNGACRYPGCTESSLMADATDGTEGSDGGNAGVINIDGLITGCSKFSLNGGNGGSGGRGGDAQGNTGSGSKGGKGGDAGTITGLKESSCENTFSLNAGNGGPGGDAGNSVSCFPGSSSSPGNLCEQTTPWYMHQAGISGNGGDAGDGGKAGSCSDCNTDSQGGKSGIKGKGGFDYGVRCGDDLVSDCGKPCKPSGTDGKAGNSQDSVSFISNAVLPPENYALTISADISAKNSDANPTACDDLLCKIEIRGDCSGGAVEYTDEVEYNITGGHGSLANSYPNGVINDVANCDWDYSSCTCVVKLTIPKQYTYYGDNINCIAKMEDRCDEATASDSIGIAPKC